MRVHGFLPQHVIAPGTGRLELRHPFLQGKVSLVHVLQLRRGLKATCRDAWNASREETAHTAREKYSAW